MMIAQRREQNHSIITVVWVMSLLFMLQESNAFILTQDSSRSSNCISTMSNVCVGKKWSSSVIRYMSSNELEENASVDSNINSNNDISNTETQISNEAFIQQQQQEGGNKDMTLEYMMDAMGTSRRRLLAGGLSSLGIALAGNLFGVTSSLLQALPEDVVERSKLDTYYARGDFKRFTSEYYTLLLPKNWVADQALELQKVQLRARTLDYTMSSSSRDNNIKYSIPDAAFGPAGKFMERGISSSDTNVSILVSKVPIFESLQRTLGTPQQAAEYLLTNFLAPSNSGRIATLLSAQERNNHNDDGSYQMEYIIERPQQPQQKTLKAISIIAPSKSRDTIINMTIVAPKSDWENDPSYQAKLIKMATSFKVIK